MWFDSHCHLYDCEDPTGAAQRATATGVEGMLIPGVDAATSKAAVAIAHEVDGWAAVGIHPSESRGFEESWLDEIEELLEDRRVVAVGETGLDYYWDRSYDDDQERALSAQIDLAKKHRVALVLHTRESIDSTLDLLEARDPPERLVFHCWSADEQALARALATGAFVSFAGNLSYKSSSALRKLARLIPDNRLLIETDSPYLTPAPNRGRPNEPANVVYVGEALATARAESVDEIARVTTANAHSLFGIEARSS